MFSYPCKSCSDRCVGCHSTCQKYKEAREKHTHKTEADRNIRIAEWTAEDVKMDAIRAARKRKNKRR